MLTGGCTGISSEAAGTDVVLPDLVDFPAWLDDFVLAARLRRRSRRQLRTHDSVLVAFSGGADSAFLLAAAVRALGPGRRGRCHGVQRLAAAERARSGPRPRRVARPRAAHAADLGRWSARATAPTRATAAAFCKSELLDVLGPLAAEQGYAVVATGTNADDARAGFRPGISAAAERVL